MCDNEPWEDFAVYELANEEDDALTDEWDEDAFPGEDSDDTDRDE